MIDLSATLGFSATFDLQNLVLEFGEDVVSSGTRELRFDALAPVLLNALSDGPDLIARIYPQVYTRQDEPNLRDTRCRFEISVLNCGSIGPEPIKTVGHYHNAIPGTTITFSKIIEVIQGRCHFLLQRSRPPYNDISDAVLLLAEKGERIVIPPDYGHIELNPTQEPVVLASWIPLDAREISEPFLVRKGGCYYATRAENTLLFVPNQAYPNIPTLRVGRAHEVPDFALTGQTLYRSMLQEPQKLKVFARADCHLDKFRDIFKFAQEMHGLLL